MIFSSKYDQDEHFKNIEHLYKLCLSDNDNFEYLVNLIIIQLVITLEVYIERLSRPFSDECSNLKAYTLPTRVRIEHSRKILNSLNKKIDLNHGEHYRYCEKLFLDISNIWGNKNHKIKLNYSLKFSSGKHGDKEIEKIFERIGIDNIFSRIEIVQNSPTLLDDEQFLNVRLFIQELVNHRNLAIHQGVNLSDRFSIENIKEKIDTLKDIFIQINFILDNHLISIKGTSLDEVKGNSQLVYQRALSVL
ncbi:hypothetical protein ACFGZC_05755 [Pasteurella multocida]